MAYIIFVNPAILSQAGLDFGAVFTATCLSAAIATFLMGVAAGYPIALAPGMGQNVFFVSVVAGMGIAWREALAAVFASGVIFLALTASRLRSRLIEAIPASLKTGIAVGIGLLIGLIGVVNAGWLHRTAAGRVLPGHLLTAPSLVTLVGLAVTLLLLARRVRGALLAGIATAMLLALAMGLVRYQGVLGPPPSLGPTFMKMDLGGVLRWEMIPVVLVFLYMAVFDAIGTLVAVGQRAGLLVDGTLARPGRALGAGAAGTVIGAALGTSTLTAYIESATGVQEGGRTGFANMITAGLFLAALGAEPVARMLGGGVPGAGGETLYPITAPALLLVGALMAGGVGRIGWRDPTEAVPAVIVMAGIPITFSIADGLAMGFIAYAAIKPLAGRWREVPGLVYLLAGVFAARYVLG